MTNLLKYLVALTLVTSAFIIGIAIGYNSQQEELKDLRITSRELIKERDSVKNGTSYTLESLQRKADSLTEERNEMQDMFDTLELEKNAIQIERDSAIEERDFNYMRYLQEQEKNQKLDVQVSTLLREKDTLKREKESVESDLQKLRVHSNDQTTRIGVQRKTISQLEKDIERLEQDISSLTRELNNVEICE